MYDCSYRMMGLYCLVRDRMSQAQRLDPAIQLQHLLECITAYSLYFVDNWAQWDCLCSDSRGAVCFAYDWKT